MEEINSKPNSESILIGSQEWASFNLGVTTFRNGDPIPEILTDREWGMACAARKPAWCYYLNNVYNDAKYEYYGKLYNWYAVNDPRGLTPEGWHIPSDEEWSILTEFLGGDIVCGEKIKSTTKWSNNGN